MCLVFSEFSWFPESSSFQTGRLFQHVFSALCASDDFWRTLSFDVHTAKVHVAELFRSISGKKTRRIHIKTFVYEKTHIKLNLKAEALYWRGGNQWRNKSQAFQATHRQHYYRQQKQELALLHERFILNLEGEVMCPAPTSCFNPQGPYKQFMPHRGA